MTATVVILGLELPRRRNLRSTDLLLPLLLLPCQSFVVFVGQDF
jgi:hypothetical protein